MQGEFIARSGWRYHWEVNTVQIPWEIYTHELSVDGNQPSAAAGKPGSNLLDGLLSLLQVRDHFSLPKEGRCRQNTQQLLVLWDYLLHSHITAQDVLFSIPCPSHQTSSEGTCNTTVPQS